MINFWDFNAWGGFNVIAVLLVSLLAASMLKRAFPILKASLIPTSVLGGGILILVAAVTLILSPMALSRLVFSLCGLVVLFIGIGMLTDRLKSRKRLTKGDDNIIDAL